MDTEMERLYGLVDEYAEQIMEKENTYLDALKAVRQDRYSNSRKQLQVEFLNAVEDVIKRRAYLKTIS